MTTTTAPSTAPKDDPPHVSLETAAPRDSSRRARVRSLVIALNLALLAAVVLVLLMASAGSKRIQPLVEADPATTKRIDEIERALARDPANFEQAIELSRLYHDVGELPWSYDALQTAERSGTKEPAWRVRLGLAYLELGKNQDSLRVLQEAAAACSASPCPADVRAKLSIFIRLATILIERNIDSLKQRGAADEALREVLKTVRVDPSKMRAKAPASSPGGESAGGATAKPAAPRQSPPASAAAPGAAQ